MISLGSPHRLLIRPAGSAITQPVTKLGGQPTWIGGP
jgi:hypothetical protein